MANIFIHALSNHFKKCIFGIYQYVQGIKMNQMWVLLTRSYCRLVEYKTSTQMISIQERKYYEVFKFSLHKDKKDDFYQGFHVRENNVEFMTPSFLTNFLPNLFHFPLSGYLSAKPDFLLFPNMAGSFLFLTFHHFFSSGLSSHISTYYLSLEVQFTWVPLPRQFSISFW